MEQKNGGDREIRNRESWLKVGIITLFSCVLAWKIAITPILNFQDFRFQDLLSLCLALFAIFLSAAFYFKATEASNRFYDNTYKFTKDVSEILGRIEAGFGERLKHIDEGYSGLAEKFDKTYEDPKKAEKDVKAEEEQVILPAHRAGLLSGGANHPCAS